MLQTKSISNFKSTCESMAETINTDAAIAEAEAELEETRRLFDAREVLTALRRKHFG